MGCAADEQDMKVDDEGPSDLDVQLDCPSAGASNHVDGGSGPDQEAAALIKKDLFKWVLTCSSHSFPFSYCTVALHAVVPSMPSIGTLESANSYLHYTPLHSTPVSVATEHSSPSVL